VFEREEEERRVPGCGHKMTTFVDAFSIAQYSRFA